MRIYLSTEKPDDNSYIWLSDIATFECQVLDSEAQSIVLDKFLSNFSHAELSPLLQQVAKKLRMGCELTIIETDIEFVAKRCIRGEIDIGEVNALLFQTSFIKSVCTLSNIEKNIPNNLQIHHKHFDGALSQIIIKCRRTE